MNQDLKMIKKKYGEAMMHLCRGLFPTILETEGELLKLLENNFAHNRFLAEDIVKYNKIADFRDFIYEKYDLKRENRINTGKTVQDLFREVGYTLYECYTEDDIQKFKKYYEHDEELCTFRGGRLKDCYVFFAVKDNAEDLKREDYLKPNRQDEYGTSVLSIQYTKGKYNTLSIKNRYNHTVVNPDATFSNDLDNIIPGLNQAFEKKYHLSNVYDYRGFELPGYILASDHKFYKYNYEVDNVYYCINNIIIDNFKVIDKYGDKEKYLLMDYFIIDLENKKVMLYENFKKKESFQDNFNDIKKITIYRDRNSEIKDIFFTFQNNEMAIIEVNKFNQMIKLYDEHIKTTTKCYLDNNLYLKKISLPNINNIASYFLTNNRVLEDAFLIKVKDIDAFFLCNNVELKNIRLPEVVNIGAYFLQSNNKIKELYFPNVNDIKGSFMIDNNSVTSVMMPKVKKIGDYFLQGNNCLEQISLPKVEIVGLNFLILNTRLKEIVLPNVVEIDNGFLVYNNGISFMFAPKLTKVGDNFMSSNTGLRGVNLPNVESVGKLFISHNEVIEYVNMPNLKYVGNYFLGKNKSLKEISLDKLVKCDNNFLIDNHNIRVVNLPNLEDIGQGFLYQNEMLTELYLPKVKTIGHSFLRTNGKIVKIVAPKLEEIDCSNTLLKADRLEQFIAPKIQDEVNNFINNDENIKVLKKVK